ncbi:MAG: MBL fold metallo-hydrolase [Candidatus Aenigmarchaeota archaeon]|nr:MBL fold metallo-hydrolase [Candidatus Aenigmarchaeota archaeon]
MQIITIGSGSDAGTPRIGCKCAGCRSRKPKDNRLRAALALKKKDEHFIIDIGPDFRQQVMRYGIDYNNIEASVMTHAHNDHCIGLWERSALTMKQVRALTVYSHPQILDYYFNQNSSFYYLKSSGFVVPKEREPNKKIKTKNFSFHTFEVPHTPSFLGPTLGLSFENKKFVYIVEASKITEAMKEEINGTHTLFMNGTFLKENLFSHISIKNSIPILNNLDVKKIYFIGLNHTEGTQEQVEKYLKPYGYKLAYDGMKIKV